MLTLCSANESTSCYQPVSILYTYSFQIITYFLNGCYISSSRGRNGNGLDIFFYNRPIRLLHFSAYPAGSTAKKRVSLQISVSHRGRMGCTQAQFHGACVQLQLKAPSLHLCNFLWISRHGRKKPGSSLNLSWILIESFLHGTLVLHLLFLILIFHSFGLLCNSVLDGQYN